MDRLLYPGQTDALIKLRSVAFRRDGFTCRYCGLRNVALSVDHIVPRSRGGLDNLSNLATSCTICNSSKRDLSAHEWADGWHPGAQGVPVDTSQWLTCIDAFPLVEDYIEHPKFGIGKALAMYMLGIDRVICIRFQPQYQHSGVKQFVEKFACLRRYQDWPQGLGERGRTSERA